MTMKCKDCRWMEANGHKGQRNGEMVDGKMVGGTIIDLGLCHGAPPGWSSPNSCGPPIVDLNNDWCSLFEPVSLLGRLFRKKGSRR